MNQIQIGFAKNYKNPEVVCATEGEILLHVLLANGIALQHDCGGICTCGTCLVYVDAGAEAIEPISRRELHVLKENMNTTTTSRLACQCVLLNKNATLQIVIPEQENYPAA